MTRLWSATVAATCWAATMKQKATTNDDYFMDLDSYPALSGSYKIMMRYSIYTYYYYLYQQLFKLLVDAKVSLRYSLCGRG